MKIPVYWGCTISTYQYAYELSLRTVARALGVELVELEGASCCGVPVGYVDRLSALYMACRNLALVWRAGYREVLVPCNSCHLALCESALTLRGERAVRERIRELLEEEGLELPPLDLEIVHTVDFLYERAREIEERADPVLRGFKIATFPGCHLVRPSSTGRPEDPRRPRKLDELVRIIGGDPIYWADRLECCGGPQLSISPDLALAISASRIENARDHGADLLATSCPQCFAILDSKQEAASRIVGRPLGFPVFYLTQLVGLALGISPRELGLQLNLSPAGEILSRMGF